MRVLVIVDKLGWSYASIMDGIIKYGELHDTSIDVLPVKGHESEIMALHHQYDRVFPMAHQIMKCLPRWGRYFDFNRWLTGIHSHHAWDDRKTTPDRDVTPPARLIRFLSKFRGVNAVSQRLTNLFRVQGLDVTYTPNGIDTSIFNPTHPIGDALRVGTAYKPKHDWRKGVTEFIRPACQKAGVQLTEAVDLPQEAMPAFWNSVDLGVFMPSSEGFSIALLEAASCGRPVISTRVGGAVELISHGADGYLVDRNVNTLSGFLTYLKDRPAEVKAMGECARQTVEEKWSWEKRVGDWLRFLGG